MLTYMLFKAQSMLLSATQEGPAESDLQTIQNEGDALVSNNQEGPAR